MFYVMLCLLLVTCNCKFIIATTTTCFLFALLATKLALLDDPPQPGRRRLVLHVVCVLFSFMGCGIASMINCV